MTRYKVMASTATAWGVLLCIAPTGAQLYGPVDADLPLGRASIDQPLAPADEAQFVARAWTIAAWVEPDMLPPDIAFGTGTNWPFNAVIVGVLPTRVAWSAGAPFAIVAAATAPQCNLALRLVPETNSVAFDGRHEGIA